jgi:AcrR family transcriptional regulator
MPTNNVSEQSERTREQLLDAAESLFVENGFDNVSVRTIIREAGQKNQSVLQYHFGNRDGLIRAIQDRRIAQLEQRRAKVVREALHANPTLDLREACALLIKAPFILCREDKSFRQFVGEFGQRLIASGELISVALAQPDSSSQSQLRDILWRGMNHLGDKLLKEMRLENMSSFVLLSISRRARAGGSFRGRRAELFVSNLTDLMAAMLLAPASPDTLEIIESK